MLRNFQSNFRKLPTNLWDVIAYHPPKEKQQPTTSSPTYLVSYLLTYVFMYSLLVHRCPSGHTPVYTTHQLLITVVACTWQPHAHAPLAANMERTCSMCGKNGARALCCVSTFFLCGDLPRQILDYLTCPPMQCANIIYHVLPSPRSLTALQKWHADSGAVNNV